MRRNLQRKITGGPGIASAKGCEQIELGCPWADPRQGDERGPGLGVCHFPKLGEVEFTRGYPFRYRDERASLCSGKPQFHKLGGFHPRDHFRVEGGELRFKPSPDRPGRQKRNHLAGHDPEQSCEPTFIPPQGWYAVCLNYGKEPGLDGAQFSHRRTQLVFCFKGLHRQRLRRANWQTASPGWPEVLLPRVFLII